MLNLGPDDQGMFDDERFTTQRVHARNDFMNLAFVKQTETCEVNLRSSHSLVPRARHCARRVVSQCCL